MFSVDLSSTVLKHLKPEAKACHEAKDRPIVAKVSAA